jgi:hypothetical protein
VRFPPVADPLLRRVCRAPAKLETPPPLRLARRLAGAGRAVVLARAATTRRSWPGAPAVRRGRPPGPGCGPAPWSVAGPRSAVLLDQAVNAVGLGSPRAHGPKPAEWPGFLFFLFGLFRLYSNNSGIVPKFIEIRIKVGKYEINFIGQILMCSRE